MNIKKLPYPPSPTNVPEGLTDYPATYKAQQNILIAGLFMFLLVYLGLICLFALLCIYCVMTVDRAAPFKILGAALSGTFLLYLLKGFFKRHPVEKELHVEVTEEEQPVLFAFIEQLCDELDAPRPNRVFVSLDVNAAVMPRTSLVNLFVQPKKDLLIGLGLVNCMNLSEFKSVMAHEFGHFCQSATASSYTYIAQRIIIDLVEGEDWFDRFIDWCKRQRFRIRTSDDEDNGAAFVLRYGLAIIGYGVGGMLWIGRKILSFMFRAIQIQRMAVSREQEFHADLVAVSAAGSDAVPLSLLRMRLGNICLGQAVDDLRTAAEHELYTRDLFYHQEHAIPVVRRKRKDSRLGERPELDHPLAGKDVLVFDPEREAEEQEDIPEMRRSHPSFPETEANAKATFVPGPVDIRSPWILFTDADDLKERLTYKFYRRAMRIPKKAELSEPEKVQQYIDNEHAETTYDAKYGGAYDDRIVEPGDVAELNQQIRESPWADERIDKVMEKLYDSAKRRVEDYDELLKERATLDHPGRKGAKVKRMLKEVDEQIEKARDWFKSLDRRVYLAHVQIAARVNAEWHDELVERYRFQVEVQRMFQEARFHQGRAYAYTQFLFSLPPERIYNELIVEVQQILRLAWRALKTILQDAREINLPAMKNFEEGDRLADFLLGERLISEPPLSSVRGKWTHKLLGQLEKVKNRCARLHFKSLGGILAIQEKVAAEWAARRVPVDAVVEPAEVIEAEVIAAEPVELVKVAAIVDAIPAAEVVTGLAARAAHAAPILDATPVMEAEVIEADVVVEVAEVVEAAPVAPPPAAVAPEPPAVESPPEPEPVFVLPPITDAPSDAVAPPALTGDPVAEIFALGAVPGPAAGPALGLELISEPPPPAPAPAVPDTDFPILDLGAAPVAPKPPPEPAPQPRELHTVVKPATSNRPAIRITFVRPGEKSPLAGM